MRSSTNNALLTAVGLGNISDVRLHMLNSSINLNSSEGLALRTASHEQHYAIALLLLDDPRIDPSLCRNSALRLAIDAGNIQLVEKILSDDRVVQHIRANGLTLTHSVSLRIVHLVHCAVSRAS